MTFQIKEVNTNKDIIPLDTNMQSYFFLSHEFWKKKIITMRILHLVFFFQLNNFGLLRLFEIAVNIKKYQITKPIQLFDIFLIKTCNIK